MTTKLTLTLDSDVITRAKIEAARQNTSLSRLVEGYFRRITGEDTGPSSVRYAAPITDSLVGIAKGSAGKDLNYKELLSEALEEKYL